MSGIAGVFHVDGSPVGAGVIRAMTELVRPFAADSRDVWADGPVALGQAAFPTTPEARYEEQPLRAGPFALVADARVDNRAELIRQLDDRLRSLGLPSEHKPVTDADLLLAAYAEWGREAPRHVIGDFAFAVWDARDGSVFVATDVFGIRPVYLFRDSRRVLFASEPRALFAAGVPRVVDEDRASELLLHGFEDTPDRTLFRDVRMLPSGHAFVASRDGLEEWRHTEISPSTAPVPEDDADIEARFTELFQEAVRCRMRGDDRVGAQLSGGLDSSAVACVARDLLAEGQRLPLDTFTLTFDATPEVDEREFSDAVLETGGFRPHDVPTDRLGPLSNLDDVYAAMDDGPAVGTQHLVWALCKAAGEAGVRVLLDGIDGDLVVEHGQNRLYELARDGDWATFFAEAEALVGRHRGVTRLHAFERDFGTSPSMLFSGYGMPALRALADEGPLWAFARSLREASRFGARPAVILRRVWRRALLPAPLLRRLRPGPPRPVRNVRAEQLEALRGSKLPRGLALASHAAAAHGVELAHPFLDLRLVRFCLALPSSQSLRDGWTRSILRRGLADRLPPLVRDRVGKTSMSPAYHRALFDVDVDLLKRLSSLSPLSDPPVPRSEMLEASERLTDAYRRGEPIEGRETALLGARASVLAWLAHQTQ